RRPRSLTPLYSSAASAVYICAHHTTCASRAPHDLRFARTTRLALRAHHTTRIWSKINNKK
ncbi:MAG: hypothetical protein K2M63_09270, partial [Muribaculaceae bacterium]|nr:hypothetical protein [Muribaculaceae bacterium]